MTGKDLILYILQNNLENEPVFKNGAFIGFLTVDKVAEKMNTGVATVYTMVSLGMIDYIIVGEAVLIPADFKPPKVFNDRKE